MATHELLGRIFLNGKIKTITGLRIGGSTSSLSIGGVDLPVIRDSLTNQPFIPGSSLKGKMRSLSEKLSGAPQNKYIGGPTIHVAGGDRRKYPRGQEGDIEYRRTGESEYKKYWVNPVFGLPSEVDFDVPAPNRLIVRDIPLNIDSAQELLHVHTDLPYTEVKWEVAVDRVTSKANPRQIERVPAGAVFGPMEMVFSVYLLPGDVRLFTHLLTAMQLLEDDYLGGHGSRGSGKIQFTDLSISLRVGKDYQLKTDSRFQDDQLKTLPALLAKQDDLVAWIESTLTTAGQPPAGE